MLIHFIFQGFEVHVTESEIWNVEWCCVIFRLMHAYTDSLELQSFNLKNISFVIMNLPVHRWISEKNILTCILCAPIYPFHPLRSQYYFSKCLSYSFLIYLWEYWCIASVLGRVAYWPVHEVKRVGNSTCWASNWNKGLISIYCNRM